MQNILFQFAQRNKMLFPSLFMEWGHLFILQAYRYEQIVSMIRFPNTMASQVTIKSNCFCVPSLERHSLLDNDCVVSRALSYKAINTLLSCVLSMMLRWKHEDISRGALARSWIDLLLVLTFTCQVQLKLEGGSFVKLGKQNHKFHNLDFRVRVLQQVKE